LHDINTECPQEKNIVPTYAAAIPQQVDELNSQEFMLLNWNSYKGSNKGWLEDLERLRKR
jgi:hypothetical protein